MKRILLIPFIIFLFNSYLTQEEIREKLSSELFPFYHGVASGDPLSDAVILWTRYTNDSLTTDSIQINWRIATDTSMLNIINSGSGYTDDSKDWTFKVDALNLQPNTYYYYDFEANNKYSLRGRTKTTPIGDIDSVRLGLVSCSNWQHGYFHAYKQLVIRNDVDCIVHLGDYIYEYQEGGYSSDLDDRNHLPTHEVISLNDYRLRYSQYRLDKDLRDLHQQYPFIMVWDDHESANNSYQDGASNHSVATEGSWNNRKENSINAYHEWLPIRTPDMQNKLKIYREFQWGNLFNLSMLDTRLIGRTEQNNSFNDTTKRILGNDQFNWLTSNLGTSTAKWNIIGQQVMMAPLQDLSGPVNNDQWDGYNYERNLLYNYILNNNIENFIVLTGDIHSSWVNDIPLSSYSAANCQNSLGVEFVVTSVTSASTDVSYPTSLIQYANPHVQYVETTQKGYAVLDITKQKIQTDYYYVNNVEDTVSGDYYADGYYVNDLEKCANQATAPTSRSLPLQHYAPSKPFNLSNSVKEINFTLMGAYPNPTNDKVTFQYFIKKHETINVKIYTIQGQLLFNDQVYSNSLGSNYILLDFSSLKNGIYKVVMSSSDKKITKTITKI